MITPFINESLDNFVIPMIRGLVEIHPCTINNKKFHFGVISRQSCRRAGTRYNMRGSDPDGNVANFVETEQFVICMFFWYFPTFLDDGLIASFVIIRGSIPLIWTQYANLKYTPEMKFLNDKTKQVCN